MSQPVTSDDNTQNLQSSASLASFESTDLSTFCTTLTKSLQSAIARASSSTQRSGWNHYNRTSLENVLYSGIPWTELLTHHQRRQKPRASTASNTPLAEVMTLLLNPCIVTPALSSVVAMTFFRVVVEDTTCKSVSGSPLLPALQLLLTTQPYATRQVGSAWIAYIQTSVRLQVDTLESYNVERAHRVVSLCKHLATNMEYGTVLVDCLLTLLQNLDDVDAKLLQQSGRTRQHRRNDPFSCTCNIQRNKKRKRGGVRALDLLDDDLMNGDEDASDGLQVSTVEVAGGGSIEKVSRVVVPQHRRHGTECNACRIRKSSQGITRLSIQLVMLRSRVYKKVLSIFGTLCTRHTENELRSNRQRPTNRNPLLWSMMCHACQHPESASLRLCLLLLADSSSFRGYESVVGYLWRLYEQRALTLGKAILKIYSEILVECSHFDDSNRFWEALQPLMRQVTRYCDSKLASLSNETRARVRFIFRSFSYILCHRRHGLVPFEADPNWKKLVSKLTMAFEDEEWWLTNDMSPGDRKETLATLQAVGILGFLVNGEGKEESVEKCTPWPFTDVTSIRSAHRRMGPDIGRHGLLSKPVLRPTTPSSPVLRRKSKTDDCTTGVPIMDYLNDDLLRTTFSFLGYKRLVKASGICKAWKSLIDSDALWRQAYMARFTTRQECESIDVRWKTVFMNKLFAEKALRFKRHSSGWKHRTCEHIGCLMVLRSPNQMTMHYRSHKKRTAKQQKKKRPTTKRRRLNAKDSQTVVKAKMV
jgi:hypothetical protein